MHGICSALSRTHHRGHSGREQAARWRVASDREFAVANIRGPYREIYQRPSRHAARHRDVRRAEDGEAGVRHAVAPDDDGKSAARHVARIIGGGAVDEVGAGRKDGAGWRDALDHHIGVTRIAGRDREAHRCARRAFARRLQQRGTDHLRRRGVAHRDGEPASVGITDAIPRLAKHRGDAGREQAAGRRGASPSEVGRAMVGGED